MAEQGGEGGAVTAVADGDQVISHHLRAGL